MWLQLVHEFTFIRCPVLQGLFWDQNLVLAKTHLGPYGSEPSISSADVGYIYEKWVCKLMLHVQIAVHTLKINF